MLIEFLENQIESITLNNKIDSNKLLSLTQTCEIIEIAPQCESISNSLTIYCDCESTDTEAMLLGDIESDILRILEILRSLGKSC